MPPPWLAALAMLALAPLAAADAQAPPPAQTPQALFEGLIVNDPATAAAVRDLLSSDAGYVAQPAFVDLTGDQRADAVVHVRIPGAAGTVAVYVFSTDGAPGGSLRAVLRVQHLYRGTTRLAVPRLIVSAPRYAEGDDLCCPGVRVDRDYTWSTRAHAMRRRAVRISRLRP